MFDYLWGGKPDKINRKTICKNYMQGGLKMVNLYHFEKSLKLSWMKKVASQTDSPWYCLLQETIPNINRLFSLGGEWCFKFVKNLNPFWETVFCNWINFCRENKVQNNSDILRSCIWFNYQITKDKLFFYTWFKNGIVAVGDILDTNGKIMDLNVLKDKYNFNINILNYLSVKQIINNFVNQNKKGNTYNYERPFLPFHVTILNPSKNKNKEFYQKLNMSEPISPLCETKWNLKLSLPQCEQYWNAFYKACFKSIVDNSYIWLQYRIFYEILGTRDYLCKTKIQTSPLCGL